MGCPNDHSTKRDLMSNCTTLSLSEHSSLALPEVETNCLPARLGKRLWVTPAEFLQTTQFIYDGNGNMVKKIKPDGSRTIYVGGIYEVDKNSGGTVTRTVTYYPAGGAMRINIVGGSNTLYYILKDHLGSASVITDANGVTVGETRYYPYGETRLTTGTIFTDKLFTGQREMAGLGIYHYGARFYSSKLGRFLSADTITPDPFNSQDLNRFSYVRNNPLRYTDPTGHMMTVDDGGGGGCYPCTPPPPSGGTTGGRTATRTTTTPTTTPTTTGGGVCNVGCELNKDLVDIVDTLYDIYGSNSDTGCNTTLLWNGNSNSWCHDNEFTQVACYFCSPDQALIYNLQFAYPLQYNNPIPIGTTRTDGWVVGGDFFPDGYSGPTDWLRANGAVWVKNEGYTTTNHTYPSHIFHEGNIVQTISEGPYGSSLITVNGQGENSSFWVAAANQYGGPIAFRATDTLMLVYATTDQIMNAIP